MIKEYLLMYEATTSEPVFSNGLWERNITKTLHEITLRGKSLVDVVNYASYSLDIQHIIKVEAIEYD